MTERDYAAELNTKLAEAFDDVLREASALLNGALDHHADAMLAVFIRDKSFSVSLGLSVELKDNGKIEVDLNTAYVKERVKEKTSAIVEPGQEKLPGMGERAETMVTITTGDGQSATGTLSQLADGVAKVRAARAKKRGKVA